MSHAHFNDPAHIRAFLAGQLPPEAVAAFEQALRDDPALAQQVEAERLAQLAGEVLIRQQLRAQMRQWAQQPPAATTEHSTPTRNRKWWAAGVLLLLAALAVYFYWPRPVTPPPPAQIPPGPATSPPPAPPTTTQTPAPATNPATPRLQARITAEEQEARRLHVYFVPPEKRGGQQEQVLEKALEAVTVGHYSEVLQLIPADSPDVRARFLRANALFDLNRYAQAATEYGAISDDLRYGADAQFNQMLCYRAQGAPQHEAFLQALQALAEQGDPRAVRLQKDIRQ